LTISPPGVTLPGVQKTVVINIVGLSPSLIGSDTPRIKAFCDAGKTAAIEPSLPAVTTSVQSSFLTGCWPDEHGIVGNGWYSREDAEVKFWKQSNALVQRPSLWEAARAEDSSFTVANLFWWYNMYSSADYSVTPRPMYPADGRKLPDVYAKPESLRHDLQRQLGTFPLFKFWGPATSIESTRWIADATILVDKAHDATLTLVYLPHLDYGLQKFAADSPQVRSDLREVDAEVGKLVDHFRGASVVLLSEYGIAPVDRPVHLNRVLRQKGLIAVRDEMGRELLDAGASRAFAVADHQVAHVYVNDARVMREVRTLLEATPGVAAVYAGEERKAIRLYHPRAGDLVALAEAGAWFTYYYWLDDAKAPDFARTVDIHRKPGYDPVEMFLDPKLPAPKAKIAWTLLKRKLGMRALLDVIGLDATVVRGSHGLPPASPEAGPLVATNRPDLIDRSAYAAPAVRDLLLAHLRAG
jgi:predicted AlkP superfamily pyrophosphatase or phosphodiesterase